ncbi:MAG: hypothetical protein K5922_02740 [Clostridiales bacterium]|nr:hypothetical protein [Clostridiales bacterium]
MKAVLLIALVLGILFAGLPSPAAPARAEDPLLLEAEDLQIVLSGTVPDPEGIRLVLSCRNRTDREEKLLFLIPRADGTDTVFDSGWPSEELTLPAETEEKAELVILPAEGENAMKELSLRMAFRGRLSSPAVIRPGEENLCDAARMDGNETQIVQEESGWTGGAPPEAIRIEDRISPEESAKLDYGQAWICLREEDFLVPFCRVPLRADPEGRAEAEYSGLTLTLEGLDQPLETREMNREAQPASEFPEGGRDSRRTENPTEEKDPAPENGKPEDVQWETREISLTGESVFYATLKLTVSGNPRDGFRVTRQELSSSELGGTYGQAPAGLLDTAEPLLRVLEMSEAPADAVDIRSRLISLSDPLRVQISPAAEWGGLWIYCEYFFTDGTDTVHAPYPVQGSF